MVFYPENGIEKLERRLSSTRKKRDGNKGGAPESAPSTLAISHVNLFPAKLVGHMVIYIDVLNSLLKKGVDNNGLEPNQVASN